VSLNNLKRTRDKMSIYIIYTVEILLLLYYYIVIHYYYY